jgi:ABC-2 type transport system permease protein
MKLHRIYALVARHMYLYRRSLPRVMEIFYWPFLDLVIWGFITVYLMKFQGQIPGAVTFFLGALILWDVLFRSQQGVTISFLEEIWARNLMNLFASPLKPNEFLAATMVMSIFKVLAVSVVMVVCAGLFYSYNIFVIGLWLVPFVLNLVLTGWIIGVVTTALIMRFGQQAEVLAWSMVFLFQPISCVFYPMCLKGCVPYSTRLPSRAPISAGRPVSICCFSVWSLPSSIGCSSCAEKGDCWSASGNNR